MEVLVPVIVEAVLETVREDLVEYLVQSKVCLWSKRKMRRVCSNIDKQDSIDRALERVKQASLPSKILQYATKISSI